MPSSDDLFPDGVVGHDIHDVPQHLRKKGVASIEGTIHDLWPQPNYQRIVLEGQPVEVAFRLLSVRNCLLPQWDIRSKETTRPDYVSGIITLRVVFDRYLDHHSLTILREDVRHLSKREVLAVFQRSVIATIKDGIQSLYLFNDPLHNLPDYRSAAYNRWPFGASSLSLNACEGSADVSKLWGTIALRSGLRAIASPKYAEQDVFLEAFGLKRVSFGPIVWSAERAQFIQETFTALFDMAEILEIPPTWLGLGTRLSIGFATEIEGKRWIARYHPDNRSIKFTYGGVHGTLAHEWFHAFEDWLNYNHISVPRSSEPAEIVKRLYFLVRGPKDSPTAFFKQAKRRDYGRRPYYQKPEELIARLFEAMLYDRLKERGGRNDFLLNPDEHELPEKYQYRSQYPVGDERTTLGKELWDYLQTIFAHMRESEAAAARYIASCKSHIKSDALGCMPAESRFVLV